MTATVAAIFFVVYAGMILGGLPFLQLDRTGVALLGAIAIVGFGALTPEQAALSIHLPTLLLLFSFMVVSAQMRLGAERGCAHATELACMLDAARAAGGANHHFRVLELPMNLVETGAFLMKNNRSQQKTVLECACEA